MAQIKPTQNVEYDIKNCIWRALFDLTDQTYLIHDNTGCM